MGHGTVRSMCDLYSITRNYAAIRDLFKVGRDTTGNLPSLPAIFPDQVAPVVRVAAVGHYLCRPYPPYGPAYVPPR